MGPGERAPGHAFLPWALVSAVLVERHSSNVRPLVISTGAVASRHKHSGALRVDDDGQAVVLAELVVDVAQVAVDSSIDTRR